MSIRTKKITWNPKKAGKSKASASRFVNGVRTALRAGKYLSARLSRRKGNSYTRTRTKLKRKPRHDDIGGTIGSTKLSITMSKRRKLFRTTGQHKIFHQYGMTSISGAGQQAVTTVAGHFLRTHFLTSASNTAYSYQASPISYFDADPSAKSTGSAVYAVQPTVATSKVHVRYAAVELMITNNSSSPAVAELMWCLDKKGTQQQTGPQDEFRLCAQGEAVGQAVAVQATESAGAVAPGTAGYPPYSTWGMKPTSIKTFNMLFKVLRRRKFFLAPGECQRINYVIKLNRTFSYESVSDLSGYGIARNSVYVMLINHGIPATLDNSAPITNDAALTQTEIAVAVNVKTVVTGLPANYVDNSYVYSHIPQSVTGGDVKIANSVGSIITSVIG